MQRKTELHHISCNWTKLVLSIRFVQRQSLKGILKWVTFNIMLLVLCRHHACQLQWGQDCQDLDAAGKAAWVGVQRGA